MAQQTLSFSKYRAAVARPQVEIDGITYTGRPFTVNQAIEFMAVGEDTSESAERRGLELMRDAMASRLFTADGNPIDPAIIGALAADELNMLADFFFASGTNRPGAGIPERLAPYMEESPAATA
jgi:hypothetical protein